jgi:NitT/TauT family transport system ATP-binding protein
MELQELLMSLWQRQRFTVALVTHDVDEATYLAERVLLMSRRPGTIAESVVSGLPAQRDPIKTREDARFMAARHRLLEHLLAGGAGRAATADPG